MVRVCLSPWRGEIEGLEGQEAALCGLPISAWRASQAAGLELHSEPTGEGEVWVPPSVVARRHALVEVARLGRQHGADLLVVPGGQTASFLRALPTREPASLGWLAPGGQGDPRQRLAAAERVELDMQERSFHVDWSPPLELHLSPRLFLSVEHWVDLLWAQLLLLGPELWDRLLHRSPVLATGRMLLGLVKSLSFRPERVAAALSRRGAGVRVHPSAVVEASVLADGVEIGAGAVVRGCFVGEGARIEPLAICELSQIGPRAVVQRQAMVCFSLLLEEAGVGGVCQLSVMGARSRIKSGAFFHDQGLDGGVRYLRDGELMPAPLGMLGGCLGADSVLGSGVSLAPGRALGPGVRVVAERGVIQRPSAEPGIYGIRGGRLQAREGGGDNDLG